MRQIPGYEAYLSIKQAAGELTISTGTVRRLIQRGEIEAYRFGNQIRIVPKSLEQYIRGQKIRGQNDLY